jgi:hypothetical protein
MPAIYCDMAPTKFAEYRFVVKDHDQGGFFLVLENAGSTLDVLEQGLLSFDLREGLSVREAEEFANLINEHIIRVAYTSDDDNLTNSLDA